MATKKSTAVSTEVKTPKAGVPANQMAILAELAKRQSKAASTLSSGSEFASFKGGQLVINGARMPDDTARIIVLGVMQERAYYVEDYDPDTKAAPDCYAYGNPDGDTPEAPHEKAKNPQAKTCATCEWSKYGTANRGKGQACRQGVRIAFVAADNKTEADSAIIQAKVPPTSIKNVKGWLDTIGAAGMATPQVITELSVTPDPKTQIQVLLSVEEDATPQQLSAVLPRIATAEKSMAEPYPDFDDEEEKPAKKAAKKTTKRKF